jgi:hypothetical protein
MAGDTTEIQDAIVPAEILLHLNPARYTRSMTLLEPRWEQPKPTPGEALDMCNKVSLTVVRNPTDAIEKVLSFLGNRTEKEAHCLPHFE